MYQIMVVTHGTLADSFVETLKLFVNDIGCVHPISLADKSIYDFEEEVKAKIKEIDGPVLALVDLFQGSPFKACYAGLIGDQHSKLLSNLNFSSLLAATLSQTTKTIEEAVEEIKQSSQLIITETQQTNPLSDDDE